MPAREHDGVGWPEIPPASGPQAGRDAAHALAPLALCIGASFAMAFTPALVWRLRTGDWICLNDWFTPFYLRFVAQAYYGHVPYISDIVVPGGVTFYPWLLFVPATYAARAFAAGPFAVNLIWIFLNGIGLGAGLYFVFRHFLNRPWAAAGCTVFCLSDYGFAISHPLVTQLKILVAALWFHPRGLVSVASGGLLWQYRFPDPGFVLAFICFQIVAMARARETPAWSNLWLSGLAFGILFYVFFYCWTLVMAALSIAFVLDRAGRRAYGFTLVIGGLIGLPQLIYSIHLKHLASPEAMRRFGLLVPALRLFQEKVPALSLLAMAALALWIGSSKKFELIYIWSLVAGGILLSRSRVVTGVFFHEYHYNWLWPPFRLALVLIAAVSIFNGRFRWRPLTAWSSWAVLVLYFVGGVYVAMMCATRTWSGVALLRNYTRYKAQRLVKGVKPLAPGAMVAGDEGFCELAAVAENQRVLGGYALVRSLAVDDDQWERRAALDAYLQGTNRAEFETIAQGLTARWFWESPGFQPQVNAALMRKYDEVVQAPLRFIDQFEVRYVALPADEARLAYLRAGWTLLQRGPYWQIWERSRGFGTLGVLGLKAPPR